MLPITELAIRCVIVFYAIIFSILFALFLILISPILLIARLSDD